MADTSGERFRNRLFLASTALFVAQLVHGLAPADTDSSSLVGPIFGSVLLLTSLAAAIGTWRGSPWAGTLAGATGVLVAVGFVLYHAMPFHSAVTNPYVGEHVGALPLVTVGLTVAAGLWAVYEGVVVPRQASTASPSSTG